jgi:hypothetical protein
MKTANKPIVAEELIIDCLKEAYFKRIKAEKIGKTPRLTEEIETLEHAIQYMKSKLNHENSTN